MALTFDVGLLKTKEDSFSVGRVSVPVSLGNIIDATTKWFKITISNAGNHSWVLYNPDDDSTVDSVSGSINSNTVFEKVVYAKTQDDPFANGTNKDAFSLKVEFYNDEGLTEKLDEKEVLVNVHIYVQNDDGSWTSDSYSDQTSFYIDEFSQFTVSDDGLEAYGKDGNVKLRADYYGFRVGKVQCNGRDVLEYKMILSNQANKGIYLYNNTADNVWDKKAFVFWDLQVNSKSSDAKISIPSVGGVLEFPFDSERHYRGGKLIFPEVGEFFRILFSTNGDINPEFDMYVCNLVVMWPLP